MARRQVAVVTGASSGIGEALALALAARGTHVVLVARSVERLQALAARVEGAGGVATVLPSDLPAPGAAQTTRRKLRDGSKPTAGERGDGEEEKRESAEERVWA